MQAIDAASEIAQEIEGRLVGPVNVFDNQQPAASDRDRRNTSAVNETSRRVIPREVFLHAPQQQQEQHNQHHRAEFHHDPPVDPIEQVLPRQPDQGIESQ